MSEKKPKLRTPKSVEASLGESPKRAAYRRKLVIFGVVAGVTLVVLLGVLIWQLTKKGEARRPGYSIPTYEEDIRGHAEEREAERARNKRWKNAIIPYLFEPLSILDDKVKASLLRAMSEVHQHTCVRFRELEAEEGTTGAFLRISRGDRCSTHIGQHVRSGPQPLTVNEDCLTPDTARHLIAHVTGLYHEHTRLDRDDYVTVLYDNIRPGSEADFDKYTRVVEEHQGTPYDYSSVTHLPADALSASGSPTLVPALPGAVIGQRSRLSDIDVFKINRLYRCVGRHGCYGSKPWAPYPKSHILGGSHRTDITSLEDCKLRCLYSEQCHSLDWNPTAKRCHWHREGAGPRLVDLLNDHYVKHLPGDRCGDPYLPPALPANGSSSTTTPPPGGSSAPPPPYKAVPRLMGGQCSRNLVSGAGHGVVDGGLTASSHLRGHGPRAARLTSLEHRGAGGGWKPRHSRPAEYLQVTFTSPRHVHFVVTMGRDTRGPVKNWVSSYSLQYTTDGSTWRYITGDNSEPRSFGANTDPIGMAFTQLPESFSSRRVKAVRLFPLTWTNDVGLRVEMIGC